ncbi:MAG: methyltransferase domain-containing protein [Emcibacter sp.]|nr:methyltransferase domain-containing protein [Emcibacter sp.]
MTIDWRAISEDPNDKTAHIAWLKKYNSDVVKVFSCPKNGRDEIILSLIDEHANKNVLDIGFVEHTLEYIHRPDWFHRKLRNKFENVYALDLNEKYVDFIRENNSWEHLYAGNATDINFSFKGNPKFSVIHAGDLIEHLTDVGQLLEFVDKHLESGGHVILSTPNPVAISKLLYWARKGNIACNLEHTCWITPINMSELCARKNLIFEQSVYIAKTPFTRFLNFAMPSVFKWFKDLLIPEFVYILRKP